MSKVELYFLKHTSLCLTFILLVFPLRSFSQSTIVPTDNIATENELKESVLKGDIPPEAVYDSRERIELMSMNQENDPIPYTSIEPLEFTVPPNLTIKELKEKIIWLERLLENPALLGTKDYPGRTSLIPVPCNIGLYHEPLEKVPFDRLHEKQIGKCKTGITLDRVLEVYKVQYQFMIEQGFESTGDYIRQYYDEMLYFRPPQVSESVYRTMAPQAKELYDYLNNLEEPPDEYLSASPEQIYSRKVNAKSTTSFSGWYEYWDGYSTNYWYYYYNWNAYYYGSWYTYEPSTGDYVQISNYTGYYRDCYVYYYNTARVLQVEVLDSRYLRIYNSKWLYIGNSGDANWDYSLHCSASSRIRLETDGIELYNYNTATGTGTHGTPDIGSCFTVNGYFDMWGGTCYIDDDLIVHGYVSHTNGSIYTGYDSNNGALWVSGASYAQYNMSNGNLYVERNMFTSGCTVSPWNYGYGNGYFRQTGGYLYMGYAYGGRSDPGYLYDYDNGDNQSYIRYMYMNGNTYYDIAYHTYLRVTGWVRATTGAWLRPLGSSGDRMQLYPMRVKTDSDIEECLGKTIDTPDNNNYPEGFEVSFKLNSAQGNFQFGLSVDADLDIRIYDLMGQQVYSQTKTFRPGNWEEPIDLYYLPQGVYFYSVNSSIGHRTGKFILVK
ncbi:T9SS type A sorting domain-containing protein [bacterium]|nr:T9SS type A sorting domain-containing protein [bacterium]